MSRYTLEIWAQVGQTLECEEIELDECVTDEEAKELYHEFQQNILDTGYRLLDHTGNEVPFKSATEIDTAFHEAQQIVDRFNDEHRSGDPVTYHPNYPKINEHDKVHTYTYGRALLLTDGTPVVGLHPYGGWVALTHISNGHV